MTRLLAWVGRCWRGYGVVAAGHVNHARWVAVPSRDAAAYRSCHPKAMSSEELVRLLTYLQRKGDLFYKQLLPFLAGMLVAAGDYPDCVVFTRWN